MKNQKNSGGVWMLVGLVILLVIPMVVGHYTLAQAADPSLHADASATH